MTARTHALREIVQRAVAPRTANAIRTRPTPVAATAGGRAGRPSSVPDVQQALVVGDDRQPIAQRVQGGRIVRPAGGQGRLQVDVDARTLLLLLPVRPASGRPAADRTGCDATTHPARLRPAGRPPRATDDLGYLPVGRATRRCTTDVAAAAGPDAAERSSSGSVGSPMSTTAPAGRRRTARRARPRSTSIALRWAIVTSQACTFASEGAPRRPRGQRERFLLASSGALLAAAPHTRSTVGPALRDDCPNGAVDTSVRRPASGAGVRCCTRSVVPPRSRHDTIPRMTPAFPKARTPNPLDAPPLRSAAAA